jgi:uncharacterized protein (TIGR04255 family)
VTWGMPANAFDRPLASSAVRHILCRLEADYRACTEPLHGFSMNTISRDLFPHSPRVIYRKAPLLQVTCQFHFPPVLRIDGQVPAEFQDRVRQTFPLVERQLLPQLPPEIVQALTAQVGSGGYKFLTEDRSSTITLTSTSLSFGTLSYQGWECFHEQFRLPLSALLDIYQPSFFLRIGLRYQNIIERERIGLAGVPWSQLLRKEILAELAVKEFEENVQEARRVLRVGMPSHRAIMMFQHGFGKAQGKNESGYLMDFDFSSAEKTEVKDAESVLDKLNEGAGRAFRWCITDALHNALEPVALDDNAVG